MTSAASTRRTPPRRAGIASADLLGDVAARVREAGFGVTGLDVTIVGARPRLGDRLDAIRDRIAELTGAATVRGERQGVHGQPVGRRGRGPLDLRPRRRHPPGRPMTIRLRDTLSGDLKPLEPLEPGHVRVYSCGPTVYGPAHIGNFRSFLFADLLVRYLRYRGLRVTWVMNLTDIDDKIIRGAAAEGISHEALADRYAERFLADADALGMTRPDALPRATRHIPEIADLVATLQAKGFAYATEDGSIFFRIASWPAYGRLARLDPEAMRVGERVEADEYGKDDVRDFALWKAPKPGEPSWDTVVGPGPAGLARRVLGDEHGPARAVVRHPHGRRRPHLPAPRGRDRAVRGGDRGAVRPHLDALRPPPDGRREDGQVGRQHRARRRPDRLGRRPARAALCPDLGPLPGAAQLLGRVADGGRGRGGSHRRRARGARRRTARTAPTIPSCRRCSTGPGPGSRPGSTTT